MNEPSKPPSKARSWRCRLTSLSDQGCNLDGYLAGISDPREDLK